MKTSSQSEPGGPWMPIVMTAQQRQLLLFVALGTTNPSAARALGTDLESVKSEMRNLIKLFKAKDRAHVIAEAFRRGFLIWSEDGRLGILKEGYEKAT